ncbi:MAG: TM0996/MTH895 family glutaredoxin-like protein [Candidatus Thermoplasmatota archaeon]|nr:thioredoxin family protein [Euryarchaeota archaeon]MBU4031833.1 TM0996/MTH895 family glutaredoxin-like protein [Candidatus Thermoplasmatota archaeon]MBU4071073.1 TM0996/MTH895 family glutaredoxin-like protein [Candidatus Thermoplasmatota archaeon]MBU4145188.1 TM0996/MTH895 family glutaredoxin-like protein [Candidatus Thermoplasmatota archaeon]MBU4591139.1 TM0996/MTH895 family glutaredoxin-like protein [Candidatus Thermoplasmatota archaeon]
MKIEILGTGCAKCKSLEKNVRAAVSDMGMQAEIVKVEDINEIMDHGVMITPALFIDGQSVAVGKLLNVEEIKKILAVRK